MFLDFHCTLHKASVCEHTLIENNHLLEHVAYLCMEIFIPKFESLKYYKRLRMGRRQYESPQLEEFLLHSSRSSNLGTSLALMIAESGN